MARGTIRQRSKVRQDSWNVQVYLGTDRACEFSGTSCQNFRVIRPLWEPNRRPLPHFRREGSDGVSGGSPNGNTRNYPPLAGGKHPAPDRGGHRSLAGYGAQVPLPTQGQAVAAAQGEGLAQDGPAPDQEQLRWLARLSHVNSKPKLTHPFEFLAHSLDGCCSKPKLTHLFLVSDFVSRRSCCRPPPATRRDAVATGTDPPGVSP